MAEPRPDVHDALFELEIGALELHGFPAAQRFEIARALQHGLERLLAQEPLPALATDAAADGERRPEVTRAHVDRAAGPRAVGQALARAVYDQLQIRTR